MSHLSRNRIKKRKSKQPWREHQRATNHSSFLLHPTAPCLFNMMAKHNFQIGIICSMVFKSFPQRIIHHQVFLLEENIHVQVEHTTIWKRCNLFAQYLIQCLLLQIRLKSNILCMNLCIHIWFFPKDKFQEVGLLNEQIEVFLSHSVSIIKETGGLETHFGWVRLNHQKRSAEVKAVQPCRVTGVPQPWLLRRLFSNTEL